MDTKIIQMSRKNVKNNLRFTHVPNTQVFHIYIDLIFFNKLAFYFYLFLAILLGLWDLSSLTKDQNCGPCSEKAESYSLDHQGIPYPQLITQCKLFLWYSVLLVLI